MVVIKKIHLFQRIGTRDYKTQADRGLTPLPVVKLKHSAPPSNDTDLASLSKEHPLRALAKMPLVSKFQFEVTEDDVSRRLSDEGRLSTPIPYPIRVFSLEGLGFTRAEARQFIDLFSSDTGMGSDLYTVKVKQVELLKKSFPEEEARLNLFLFEYYAGKTNLDPVADLVTRLDHNQKKEFDSFLHTRDRSLSHFVLTRGPNGWRIEERQKEGYTQNVGSNDYRSIPRRFNRTLPDKTSHPLFRKFLTNVAELVCEFEDRSHVKVSQIEMDLHEVRLLVRDGQIVYPAPEGSHQDGSDYALTALMIGTNADGGESIVSIGPTSKGEILLRYRLEKPGVGIIHRDTGPKSSPSPVYHDVTPLTKPAHLPLGTIASRKTLGVDTRIRHSIWMDL